MAGRSVDLVKCCARQIPDGTGSLPLHERLIVISKDRDFQEFLKTPEAQRITPTLRVRRVPANEVAEKPQKKSSSAADSSEVSRGSKA